MPYCGLEDWKASLAADRDAPTLIQHLCASLEQGIPGTRLRQMIGTWTHREYSLLAPRPDAYQLTVRNLADAAGQDRAILVSDLARAEWAAWSAHHDQIRHGLPLSRQAPAAAPASTEPVATPLNRHLMGT
jgi:hypothetical protein